MAGPSRHRRVGSAVTLAVLALLVAGAHAALTCDSGSLATTCVVTSSQTFNGAVTGAALTVESGAVLQCDGQFCDASITLTGALTVNGRIEGGNIKISAATVAMGSAGRISADYLGYLAAMGPGAGGNATVLSCDARFSGSGGGHGGHGGDGNYKAADNQCDATPSLMASGGVGGYGDMYEPVSFGSGGQHAWKYPSDGNDFIIVEAGAGGGAM